jgi:excisionase family DNA binding protein
MDTLLTVKEACKALRVSRPTLYKLIWRGQIKALLVGRTWRIPTKSLQADYHNRAH